MGGAGPGAASPSGPCGEGARAEWLRIYGCMAALLRKNQGQVEALLADHTRLEEFVKIQHEFSVARVGLLQAQLQQMRKAEASRRRCDAANLELLLGEKERELHCCQKIAELTEDDLEDFITSLAALAAENTELKIKLKEVGSHGELSENTTDHEHSARDLRAELRKLKQAYKTLSSKKDKEVSALLAEKDFVWNQLRTMEQDYTALLKNKKIEAAQAIEAAQKLQQNVEKLQVATQKKDDEIGRLQANAVDAKMKISILEDKLQEMRSLAKEKDEELEKLKDGQPETSQKRKKCINDTHRKSKSEGPALREKSKTISRKQMVDEDEQPETSQKRNCTSSLSNSMEKDDEIEKLKDGQPVTSQKRKKYINDTHRKSKSEGPALREKSKTISRKQMVDENEQPEASQKRNCTSSLSNGLRRCSTRLQGRVSVSPAVQPVLFSPNFKVPKLKAPTLTWPEAASPP